MKHIGHRLKEERLRLKLSQSALGALGGVETNAQGNYENGTRSPRADYMARIAEAGVDINWVLTGKKSPDKPSLLTLEDLDPTLSTHMSHVATQLHRNLHGIIESLHEMTSLVERADENTQKHELRDQLEATRDNAEALALATVKLIFVTSRLL